nr:hypothetical protein [Tanacetum cinerariifolium]
MTGNYMPSRSDVEIDYSKFTNGLKQTSTDESDSKPSEYASCEFDSRLETTTSMPEPVENAPKVVCKPKVWTDAPIIEKENVKETVTPDHSPKVKKQDINRPTRKGLGYAFTRKTCFVCGSFSHLIRDCDFHEKRMAKQAELTNSKNKVTGQRENRPVWNNVQRINHQNKLGYGDYRYGSILSYENEVLQSVFMNKASDLEDTSVNDRYADGMLAVPLPMTGNYMPSRSDVEIDYSKFTNGLKQTSTDESDSKPSEYASCEFDSRLETTTSMPEPVENAPKVVCKPKVWTDAPIIEKYESDSDNDLVSNV